MDNDDKNKNDKNYVSYIKKELNIIKRIKQYSLINKMVYLPRLID
jgi:predicted DNA repair protein MutK